MLSLPKAQLGLYDTSVFFEMRAYVCSLPDQAPSSWKGRAKCGTDVNVVVEIPDRCLEGAGVSKHVVRVTVTVEITQGSPGPCQHVVTDTHRSFAWVCRLGRGLQVRLRLFCCPTGLQRVAGNRVLLRQIHVTGERRESECNATREND